MEKVFSLHEVDDIIRSKSRSFDYSLSDAILILLYARDFPLKGKTRQMKEVFLMLNDTLMRYVQPIAFPFTKHKFGPYSEEVEYTIDNLVLSNYISTSGSKRTNDYAIRLSQKGKKFYNLSVKIQEQLKENRKQWDTLSPKGILNVVFTHYNEYLENSLLNKRYRKINLEDDNQPPDQI